MPPRHDAACLHAAADITPYAIISSCRHDAAIMPLRLTPADTFIMLDTPLIIIYFITPYAIG